tara:strand:+ start:693 stop:1247 length:555 start_codon:yes stop_codon:yes gene_type:complete
MNNVHPILVTGPQRSGTTITARILADKFNRTYVDEIDYHPDNFKTDSIIQAPFAFKYITELSYANPELFFVIVVRDKEDIVKSMERIEWYKDIINSPGFYSSYVDSAYSTIEAQLQHLSTDRYLKLSYNSLKGHTLFVDDRKDFTSKQWQKNKAEGPKKWRNDEHLRFNALGLQDFSPSTMAAA